MLPMRVEAWKYSSFAGGKDRPKRPEAETGGHGVYWDKEPTQ